MTSVVVCCDGLDPEYLDIVDMPGWDKIADEGQMGTCSCALPSLTNVNNVSIATESYPKRHGITGNTYYDRENNARIYMEDPSFMRCKTRLQEAVARDKRVGALVAKKKLLRMIGQGCTVAVSAENPPQWLEDAIGSAPDIYSGEASPWLMEAAAIVLDNYNLDWLYVSTTDVIPHKYSPTDEPVYKWLTAMDEGFAALHKRADDIVVTADHGMSRKRLCVDIEEYLVRRDYDATVIRLIRDKHTYHHQNLGGAAYVYLKESVDKAADLLEDVDGIDLVLTTAEAAERFMLPADRIGDLMVLGTEKAVFGPVETGVHTEVDLRSHGSHHEREVPYAVTVDMDLSVNFDAFSVF